MKSYTIKVCFDATVGAYGCYTVNQDVKSPET